VTHIRRVSTLDSTPGSRIAVVGISGSGKTTLSAKLAKALGIPHIELDALHWQENWTITSLEIFRQQVGQAISGPAWIADGNYSKVRDLVWLRATTLVWLDYPLSTILWQLTCRTLSRIMRREVLWNNNRETFHGAFLSKDSIFLWVLHTYRRHRPEYTRLLSLPEYDYLQVIRLRSRKETECWLNLVEDSPGMLV
jgi:adenylate kinase family enzyme